MSGGGAYLISVGHFLIGGSIFLIAGLLDLLDGSVARTTDTSSKFGALLDSVSDRCSESIILFGLLIFYLNEGAIWEPILVYAAVSSSFMVSYVKARAEGLNIKCNVGLLQRPERVGILSIGFIIGKWWLPGTTIAVGIVTVLALFTIFQRIQHARKEFSG